MWFREIPKFRMDYSFTPNEFRYYDTGIPMYEFNVDAPDLFREVFHAAKDLSIGGRQLGHSDVVSAGKLDDKPVAGLLHAHLPADSMAWYDFRVIPVSNKMVILELGTKQK